MSATIRRTSSPNASGSRQLQPKYHRKHAKRRAKARYNLDLSREALTAMTDDIREGRADYLWRTYDRTIWRVRYDGRELLAVYELERDLIITFLPPTAVEDRRARAKRKRDKRRQRTT